jgi:hypothetical protein
MSVQRSEWFPATFGVVVDDAREPWAGEDTLNLMKKMHLLFLQNGEMIDV